MTRKPRKFTADWTSKDLFKTAHQSVAAINRTSRHLSTLTTDQAIEQALLLTKAEPSDQDIAGAAVYFALKGQITSQHANAGITFESSLLKQPSFLQRWWAACRSERSDFLLRLNELMRAPDKARARHMAADFQLLRKRLLIIGDLDDEGEIVPRLYPMTIEAGCIYVLQALYNKEHKRWKRLRKCPHCQSIFIRKISKVGGRPRDYCTAECQEKADQKRALVRQRSPEQRAKQRKRKRK